MKIKFMFFFWNNFLNQLGKLTNKGEEQQRNKKLKSERKHGQPRNNVIIKPQNITNTSNHRSKKNKSDQSHQNIKKHMTEGNLFFDLMLSYRSQNYSNRSS